MDSRGFQLSLALLINVVIMLGAYNKKLLDLHKVISLFIGFSILIWVEYRFEGIFLRLMNKRWLKLMSHREAGETANCSDFTFTGGCEEASSYSKRIDYQVFLNFRGEDVRKTFIEHLLRALLRRGIKTFHDNSTLKRGGDILIELYKAIETSKLSIVTFSPEYATSRWCLDELVKIMECRKSHGHVVVPVFYNVNPKDVKNQSGTYGKAFLAHKNNPKAHKWREALRSAANLAGFCLKNHANGYEAQLIDFIIADVVEKVDDPKLSIPKDTAGAKSLIECVSWWLQNGSSQVKIVVEYGPVSKITEASQNDKNTVLPLEDLIKLISGIEATQIYSSHEHMEIIKKQRIGSKKMWVVLDKVTQLHGRKDHYLVSVKDASTVKLQVSAIYVSEPAELARHQELNRSYQAHVFEEISVQLVNYCADMPLAIEVLACSLASKTLDTWKNQCDELEKFPDPKLSQVLKLSFDIFDRNDMDVFLRMAFFMVMKTGLQNQHSNVRKILQIKGSNAKELIVQQAQTVQNQLSSVGESIVQLAQTVQNQLNTVRQSIQMDNIGELVAEKTENLQNQLDNIRESIKKSSVAESIFEQRESLQNRLNDVQESVRQSNAREMIIEQTENLQNQLNNIQESIQQSSAAEMIVEQKENLENRLNDAQETIRQSSIREVIVEQTENLQNKFCDVKETIRQISVKEVIDKQSESLQSQVNNAKDSIVQKSQLVQNRFRGWIN